MQYYYVTGASRGLGRSMVEVLLQHGHKVVGISRSEGIENENYTHVQADLSDPKQVASIQFHDHPEAERVVLINNAGVIGDIKQVGEKADHLIVRDYHVNLVSPSILCNKFIGHYATHTCKRYILNISSGAANHPVDAWSTYSSSKAGLDMLSKNIASELESRGEDKIEVYSVSPGLIDTSMQVEIRGSQEHHFTRKEEFEGFHADGKLVSPDTVARKVLQVMEKKNLSTVVDVRDWEGII